MAGGSVHLASALDMNQWSIERWIKTGIPHKRWEEIGKIMKVSSEELHEMTINARSKRQHEEDSAQRARKLLDRKEVLAKVPGPDPDPTA